MSFEGKNSLFATPWPKPAPRSSARRCTNKYKRWPVYSKFFDNMGPIPHHMHQSHEYAKLVGQEGKPESYYFPPQLNNVDNNFAYTFMGLEPGTTKDDVRKCLEELEQGRQRHPRPLAGVPPQARHRLADPARRAACPRLAVHLRAAMGIDVFGMFQSMVEGRDVPWELLVKDVPRRSTTTSTTSSASSTGRRTSIRTSRSTTTWSRSSQRKRAGYIDKWIVYGTSTASSSSAPRSSPSNRARSARIKDPGASSWITVQGKGRIGKLDCRRQP